MATQDRLGEVRGPDFYSPQVDEEVGDVEMATMRGGRVPQVAPSPTTGTSAAHTETFMQSFFAVVGELKRDLSTIHRNIEETRQKHLQAIGEVETTRQYNQEIDLLTTQTGKLTTSVRKRLDQMDKENKEYTERNGMTSEGRIRTNMHATLTKKFLDLMRKYQDVQNECKAKYKERVERQLRIVKPDPTKEEIETVFEKGGQDIFTTAILASRDSDSAAAKNALIDIQERHRDILKLEQSIAELHQLFVDMAVLVEAQGELIDQIEYNVSQSVTFVSKAISELHQASRHQKAARKKMCFLFVLGIIILAVILGPIFGS